LIIVVAAGVFVTIGGNLKTIFDALSGVVENAANGGGGDTDGGTAG
jgi:Flp pilus assembly pilin Flp